MKKIAILILMIITSVSFAQGDSSKVTLTKYVSVGLSVTNSNDFNETSYPSLEAGVMAKHLSLSGVIGRGYLTNLFKKNDNIENYFYEIKTTAFHSIDKITGSVIFGYGSYFNTNHTFIEYGIGVSYTQGIFSYGVSSTNWDVINYITPSITLNF